MSHRVTLDKSSEIKQITTVPLLQLYLSPALIISTQMTVSLATLIQILFGYVNVLYNKFYCSQRP